MLNWCAYCQQFLGERPPYDDLRVTHSLCAACAARPESFTDGAIAHAQVLSELYGRLWEAGQRADVAAAVQAVEAAAAHRVRSVDVLVGIMAPMLYEIGAQWERAVISVADEHRFTAFCEELFRVVAERVAPTLAELQTRGSRDEVVLLNAAGNQHTLAVRILALWLAHQGVRTWTLDTDATTEESLALVERVHPTLVLVSMSLAEQRAGVAAVAAAIAALPDAWRPRVIVGGYAVKMGLVEAIPGAELLGDISGLPLASGPSATPSRGR